MIAEPRRHRRRRRPFSADATGRCCRLRRAAAAIICHAVGAMILLLYINTTLSLSFSIFSASFDYFPFDYLS
jgi:hypothetical protein